MAADIKVQELDRTNSTGCKKNKGTLLNFKSLKMGA
jgi:hypothetical protein